MLGSEPGSRRQPRPARSLRRQLRPGYEHTFPTFEDLCAWLHERGDIERVEQLYGEQLPLFSRVFFEWIRSAQLGCKFAYQLARSEEWPSLVVWGALGARGTELDRFLDDVAGDAEAVQILFPDLDRPQEIVALVNVLCASQRWYWVEVPGGRREVLIGLRWILPSNKCVNWVLGFAPGRFMPFTRRAPMTAIVLRTRDAFGPDFLGHERDVEWDRSVVHLADMHLEGWTRSRVTRHLRATETARRRLLRGELEAAAKGKVTFRLPRQWRAQLCSPRE